MKMKISAITVLIIIAVLLAAPRFWNIEKTIGQSNELSFSDSRIETTKSNNYSVESESEKNFYDVATTVNSKVFNSKATEKPTDSTYQSKTETSCRVFINTTDLESKTKNVQTRQLERTRSSESQMTEHRASASTKATISTKNKSTIDIAHFEQYAKNFANYIGLNVDNTSTDCWDNPILVSEDNGDYVIRDIESRLQRYKKTEGFQNICVWSEKRSDGRYDLYLGYS